MLIAPTLIAAAGFLVLLGVVFVMMGSRDVKDDARGLRIPRERAQILALACFVGGVGLFAYILYLKAFG